MNVLTLLPDLSLGGRQRAAQNYALGYARAGHGSAVFAYSEGGAREPALRDAGLPVFIGPEAEAEAVAWSPDAVHIHSAGTLDSVEIVLLDRFRERLGPDVPLLETTAFGRVAFSRTDLPDVRLLMTRWALWRWQRRSGTVSDPPPGIVIPISVESRSFFPAPDAEVSAFRASLGIRPEAVVVGTLARPVEEKWPPLLLHAFARLLRQRGEAEILVGALSPGAEAFVRDLPEEMQARIHALPASAGDDELRLRYSAMDLFAHASLIGETFGLVFVEAMACGTPVLTLSTPGRNNSQIEVVGPGGVVVHGARHYREALVRLVADAEERARLASAGRASVMERFTTDAVIPDLVRVAEAAAEAVSRRDLRDRLAGLGLHQPVTDDEPRALLARVEGAPSVRQQAFFHLMNSPLVAALWDRLRG